MSTKPGRLMVRPEIYLQLNDKVEVSDRAGYNVYLLSFLWAERRAPVLARAMGMCENCGVVRPLEVHHLHYYSLYEEQPEDLMALCVVCHTLADGYRRNLDQLTRAFRSFARKQSCNARCLCNGGKCMPYYTTCEAWVKFTAWVKMKETKDQWHWSAIIDEGMIEPIKLRYRETRHRWSPVAREGTHA